MLFGGAYAFLFIYGFFGLIGYEHFPNLSESIGLYFGNAVLVPSCIFIILSLLSFYSFFIILWTPILARARCGLVLTSSHTMSAFIILAIVVGWEFWYLIQNWAVLDYGNSSDKEFQDSAGIWHIIFIQAFKITFVFTLVLYAIL